MTLRRKLIALAATAAVAAAGLASASPASATDATGSWWTAHYYAACGTTLVDPQARYTNTAGGGTAYTRADGYGVYLSGGGYIRKIILEQYTGYHGTRTGLRTVNYTGSATTASAVNIPATYLPPMVNNGARRAGIFVTGSASAECGNDAIPIG